MPKTRPQFSPAAAEAADRRPTGKTPIDKVRRMLAEAFAQAPAGDRPKQDESPERRAHRQQMKELFARATRAGRAA